MYYATKSLLWIPLYCVFLFLLIRQYLWKTLWILLIAAIMILISDQLANLFKETFHRLRPSHEQGLMVHLVNAYKGGEFGFYSSHASNTFSIAVLMIVLIGKKYRWFFVPALLWCTFMSYTRVYLGVHFPGDILAGAIIGSLIGYFSGRIFLRFRSQELENAQLS